MSLSGKEYIRYSRQIMLPEVGEAGQERLLASRVAIVGLGGLGCPVALYLAAAGVGHLVLCDHDEVDLSNLQRQVLYRPEDCGKPKVMCARESLLALNPGISIDAINGRADDVSADISADLVLDCTDNLATRHFLNRFCLERKLPFISGAALGWEGQLTTFDFRKHDTPCFACATPEATDEPVANCATVGVLGPVLGVVGSLQAAAALKTLLGQPLEHGLMQRYDGRRTRWQSFRLQSNPACRCSRAC